MGAIDDLVRVTGWTGQSYAATDWDVVEQRLGIALPADYKLLHEVYPPGSFHGPNSDSIIVQPPYRVAGVVDHTWQFRAELGELRDWRDQHPDDVPDAVYPERDGLLPWARSGRPLLLWDPADWSVVVSNGGIWRLEDDDPVLERFAMGAVEFLVGVVTGEVSSRDINPGPHEPRSVSVPAFRPFPQAEWDRISVAAGPSLRHVRLPRD
ncbi:hypothetical protein [Actinokineospora diospyrosa]|uniref:SUKH superfamily protein n=1 Tax=Actinokineospora diospyrosa TaxID=103728 RepID=A0ABT1IC00_9PSEU|nr:hypothetical protein [Actinokineospora diospyrosa]MCP2270096.1 hypothetical protein [Actinokineospora diospyrosa]